MAKFPDLNILTVNWHTGYLYNLSQIGHRWSVLNKWEDCNRPLPANFQLTDWATARRNFPKFDLAIGHSIWIDVGRILPYCIRYHKPYIQVIHGRRARGGFTKSRLRVLGKQLYSSLALQSLLKLGLIRIVFVSRYDSSDWGLKGTVIDLTVPWEEMIPYDGGQPSLLVVGNSLHREHYASDCLTEIRRQIPVRVVGVNSRISDSLHSRDWDDLRTIYSQYRAYLNLNREPEKGYNSAMLEAMASGMPVISLKHPSTPIRDGENGFLVENASEAVERGKQLLADHELARKLGRCARNTVEREFSLDLFRERWNELLARSIGSDLPLGPP